MKIINRIEFLKLPNNTLFSTYDPCVFGEIQIKGETIGTNDFRVQSINDAINCGSSNDFYDILDKAQESSESFDLNFDCWSRDGLYDPDTQLYAVWDNKDVEALIERLKKTLK